MVISIERFKVNELITKYELEPSIRDIFVEGDSDVCCMNTFLHVMEIKDVKVFAIDSVDISEEYLIKNNIEKNNRGRVIALSNMLSQESFINKNVSCIIDRDFDKILLKKEINKVLMYTDYCCMEMYVYDNEIMDKFILINFSELPAGSHSTIKNLSVILQELFLIRLANKVLELELKMLDFIKFCQIKSDRTISFDKDEFIKRYLNKSSKSRQKDEFIKFIEFNRIRLDLDIRHQINGHDFIKLLIWYLGKMRSKKIEYTENTLWKTLFLCCNNELFSTEKLFVKVADRVKRI